MQTIFLCQLQLPSPQAPVFLGGCHGNYLSPTVVEAGMDSGKRRSTSSEVGSKERATANLNGFTADGFVVFC